MVPRFRPWQLVFSALSAMAFVVCACVRAEADPPVPQLRALSAEIAPVLDGALDEAIWQATEPAEIALPFTPTMDAEPRFRAEFRVLTTADALYFAVETFQPGLGVYAPVTEADVDSEADRLVVRLDPQSSALRGYEFVLTAAGVLQDSVIIADVSTDPAWDSLSEGLTQRTSTGWTAELRIPWRSLRFSPEDTQWKANVLVISKAADQGIAWSKRDSSVSNTLLNLGVIENVSSPSSGSGVEILPTVTLASFRDGRSFAPSCDFSVDPTSTERCSVRMDLGVGLKWNVSASSTVEAVYNPDFSHIESDAPQITLNNRFALYLDERRPFFLEGRDLFETPLNLVYTRSISKPLAALKFLGQHGRARGSAMIAFDQNSPDSVIDDRFSGSAFGTSAALTGLARLVLDVGKSSTVGLMFADREWVDAAARGSRNAVLMADSLIRVSESVRIESLVAGSHATALDGARLHGATGRARLVWQVERWRLQVRYAGLSDDFRAETGFLERVGTNQGFIKLDHYYRGESDAARYVSPGVWALANLGPGGQVTDTQIGANTYWEFGRRIWVFAQYERQGERYEKKWFDNNFYYLSVGSSTLRWLDVELTGSFRGAIVRDPALREKEEPAFLGTQANLSTAITLRPTEALRWTNQLDYRKVSREIGGPALATQPIFRSTLQLFATRKLNFRYFVEYNDAASALNNDILLGYLPTPGTVFYLGYQESTATQGRPLLLSRGVFAKLAILFVK